eukprot:TRINITY_DN24399_c0_g2_i3.p1 TRINITY_DN24399_c0_g2~~TRINITY_DN24399_c0_g2_i3.p1  ORF type:complete len:365 (-),score=88.63 TRINITY_DN24399_c0_g2_i3:94-1137(-)
MAMSLRSATALRGAALSSSSRRYALASARVRNYATLLVAEHDNKVMNKATAQAVAAAAAMPGSEKLDVLVLGKDCEAVAKQCASLRGVSRVLLAEAPQLEHPVADTTAEFLLQLQGSSSYGVLSGVASSLCREVLPRVAAKLDVQPITDVIGLGEEEGVFRRPMYAGNAIATVKSNDTTRIVTFRPTAFEAAPEGGSAPVERVDVSQQEGAGIEWVSDSEKSSDKPQLSSANRVVSGGRGLKNGENFETVLDPLCAKLNAAMGASRAAVDAGFVPNELQVGQTGKVVAPELYVAVGISGAIQHLAGMKDSKTIVAINKDADAPIFQVADYGLVGDLFNEVPELTKKL